MPAVTREGDSDMTHCSTPTRVGCSGNVFANKKGVSREGDSNDVHDMPNPGSPPPPCVPHSAAISSGSSTVFANGKGIGRVGDGITMCTAVAEGSDNVFAG